MKDWVFCNKCSLKFDSSTKFYLSECGHIFCQKCMDKLKETKKCSICNKSTTVMELSKDMDHTTQMFFWPLEHILQQSLQVFNFQAMHKNLFLLSLSRKYSYAKKECVNYYNANKKLQKENQMMREVLKSVGYNPPNPFITSTPASTSEPRYDNNLSMLSSIRFTPAQGIKQEKRVGQPYYGATSVNSSVQGPSPAQMVPKGYPVPVHRESSMQNPAATTPNFMSKLRGKPGYPTIGYPRK